VSGAVMLQAGELETAEIFLRDAGALNAVTGNAYESTHEKVVRAALAREKKEADLAVLHASEGRRTAERQGLVSYHFYGLALEAAARADLGEMHSATLLATTAAGAVENLQGTEYGLEVRVLSADVLKRAGSPQAPEARARALEYAVALMNTIRDRRLRRLFAERPIVASLFEGEAALLSAVRSQGELSPSPSHVSSVGSGADGEPSDAPAGGNAAS